MFSATFQIFSTLFDRRYSRFLTVDGWLFTIC